MKPIFLAWTFKITFSEMYCRFIQEKLFSERQGRRLGLLGGGGGAAAPTPKDRLPHPPPKNAAAPNLDFSKVTCMYIFKNIKKKLARPKKKKTYEFREIFIE